MNCSTAKKISIIGYLASLGILPSNLKNSSAWYCSPFRQESKPSFKVDRQNNIWFDFGTGTGGNILDLVMQLNKTGITGALLLLQKPELSKQTFSFSEQHYSEPATIEMKHLQPLQNRALIQYLNSRAISQAKAVKYIQEAYYHVNGKQYFALAFTNDGGGFELRNKYFKGSTSPKAITTIPGSNKTLNIFEGFIDFLSALEHFNMMDPTNHTIVLNSTSNLNTILETIKDFIQVNLFLDNDNAGYQAEETIKAIHPKVRNYSKILYPNINDFNDFLVQKKSILTLQNAKDRLHRQL